MLLGLHEVPVDRRMIEKYIPSHREGMSLADLQEASTALGLKTEVRRCSLDALRRAFQSPVIAYVEDSSAHYVVVIAMTDSSVTFLDGTTGERNTAPNWWLNERWLGYVLMPDSGHSVSWLLLAISLLGWLLLGFLAVKGSLRKER